MLFLKSTLLGCLDSGRSNGQGIRLVLLLVKKRIHDKLSYASASLARSSHSDTRHNFWKARPARLLFSTCWWKFTVIWISPAGFWATSRQLSPFSNHAYFVCLVASGYPHVLCGMLAFGHTCSQLQRMAVYPITSGYTDNSIEVCISKGPVGLFAGNVLVMVCVFTQSYHDVIPICKEGDASSSARLLCGASLSFLTVWGAVMLTWKTCGYFMRLPPSCREQTTNKTNESQNKNNNKTLGRLRLNKHVQVIMKQTVLIRNCIICV